MKLTAVATSTVTGYRMDVHKIECIKARLWRCYIVAPKPQRPAETLKESVYFVIHAFGLACLNLAFIKV